MFAPFTSRIAGFAIVFVGVGLLVSAGAVVIRSSHAFGLGEEGCNCAAPPPPEAPRWKVEGTYLEAGKGEPAKGKLFEAVNSTKLRLGSVEAGFNLVALPEKCSLSGEAVGSKSLQPGTAYNVVFSCSDVFDENDKEGKCKIYSEKKEFGTIRSRILSGPLVWTQGPEPSGAAGLLLETGGLTFLSFQVEGNECPLEFEEAEVFGSAIARFNSVESELGTQDMEFPGGAILKWWSNEVPRKEQTITQLYTSEGNVVLSTVFEVSIPSKVFGVFPG